MALARALVALLVQLACHYGLQCRHLCHLLPEALQPLGVLAHGLLSRPPLLPQLVQGPLEAEHRCRTAWQQPSAQHMPEQDLCRTCPSITSVVLVRVSRAGSNEAIHQPVPLRAAKRR